MYGNHTAYPKNFLPYPPSYSVAPLSRPRPVGVRPYPTGLRLNPLQLQQRQQPKLLATPATWWESFIGDYRPQHMTTGAGWTA